MYAHKIENKWELDLMVCGALSGREGQKGGDTWIRIAGSFSCAVEMDTTL